MDFRLAATTFVTIFLAELGDKTQLATLAYSAGGQSRMSIFLGSALALVASSAIAVLGGEALARAISPRLLQRLAGAAFVVIGLWVLWSTRAAA